MVRYIPICLALILIYFPSYSQTNTYYVVIGSFAIEANAARQQARANQLDIPAIYAFDFEHKLYYVFVRDTENKGDAYATQASMQQEGFRDTWVYKGNLNASIALKSSGYVQPAETVATTSPVETAIEKAVEEKPVIEIATAPVDEKPLATIPSTGGDAAAKPIGKPFIFNLVNATTGKPVKGQVHLRESEKSLQYQGVNANELFSVTPPKNKAGRWYVACYVVGFKPVKNSFLYSNPQKTPGTSVGANQEVIVPFALERVKRGDYIEMDNVVFFGNSSIFTPESERELLELVAMMEENPDYKIRLHGHTNGEPQGEIIARGESANFFAVEQTSKRTAGSAKELSTWRAEAVKEFLISKGIEASRITTKGEGNKQPIFDPKGTHAGGNDRVEVEITKS